MLESTPGGVLLLPRTVLIAAAATGLGPVCVKRIACRVVPISRTGRSATFTVSAVRVHLRSKWYVRTVRRATRSETPVRVQCSGLRRTARFQISVRSARQQPMSTLTTSTLTTVSTSSESGGAFRCRSKCAVEMFGEHLPESFQNVVQFVDHRIDVVLFAVLELCGERMNER
jgi:hypothetical protein